MKHLVLIILVLTSSLASAYVPRAFVNLFEWKWADIGKECRQVLAPLGYTAVQVSPPNEHLVAQGFPWYQRYQPVSYKLQSRSGTEEEFVRMVKDCRSAGVEVYVDAVINHMTAVFVDVPQFRGSAGSSFGHYTYPGIYSYDDFHHCQMNDGDEIRNYGNRFEVQSCELGNLADLKTESPLVRRTLVEYLRKLVSIGVTGFRIDAAKHIPASDLEAILGPFNRFYVYQEVIGSDAEPIQPREYLGTGAVTEFKFTGHVSSFFQTGKLSWFNNNKPLGEAWGYLPSNRSVVFVDNHDTQRMPGLLSHKQKEKYKLASVFMLAWPYGYPQVMSSFAFDDPRSGPPADERGQTKQVTCLPEGQRLGPSSGWVCEHRWRAIAAMVEFRRITAEEPRITDWWSNDHSQIAFGRGNKGFVVINNEATRLERMLKTSLPPGRYCNVLKASLRENGCAGNLVTVGPLGEVTVSLNSFDALALHLGSRL